MQECHLYFTPMKSEIIPQYPVSLLLLRNTKSSSDDNTSYNQH